MSEHLYRCSYEGIIIALIINIMISMIKHIFKWIQHYFRLGVRFPLFLFETLIYEGTSNSNRVYKFSFNLNEEKNTFTRRIVLISFTLVIKFVRRFSKANVRRFSKEFDRRTILKSPPNQICHENQYFGLFNWIRGKNRFRASTFY